jgi:NAD(P)-dependent dehydrogenase (short-subunit alcohol dehydrogenase family)
LPANGSRESLPRDVKDKVVLITGASSGIGVETARGMALRGAHVLITGRDRERTSAVAERLIDETRNPSIEPLIADFSSLQQVKRLAEEVQSKVGRLDVLVNNAGLWHQNRHQSVDGYEDTFAVNHLAPFLLTEELLPLLRSTGQARVVHVASRLHARPKRLALDDLQWERSPYRGLRVYAHSKLAQVVYSSELARRLAGTGVTSNSLHPGDVSTNVTRDSKFLSWGIRVAAFFLKTPEEGARTSLHIACAPALEGVSGKYFSDEREAKAHRDAQNVELGRELVRISRQLVDAALARESEASPRGAHA